jgi:hypothetical protein
MKKFNFLSELNQLIAEQKGIEVTMLARSHGFPLAIKLEQD